MAQEHLNSLLIEGGIEQKDIDAIMALTNPAADAKPEELELAKKALEPFMGKLNTTFTTKLKNDPKFWEGLDENNINEGLKKKIEAQQYGRAANIVRQKALKALGLKEEDLSDLTEEEKKNLETFISKAGEKYASTKAGDKQLQQQLVDARKKLEDLEIDIPVREGKLKQEYEQNYNNEKLDFLILAELATVENLKAPAQYLVAKLAADLKEEYAFDVKGLKASPKNKQNPTLDVLEGSKVLTLKDLIVKKLTADGAIGEQKKFPIPGKVEIEPDEKGDLKMSGHIEQMINKDKPKS